MYEMKVLPFRAMTALLLALVMAVPALPVLASGEPDAHGRSVTDDGQNLIVPSGESYELCGCHTYTQSIQIDGKLTVKPFDGSDMTTGTLYLKAPSIIVSSSGNISALGAGWTGGAAGSSNSASKGFGGKGPGAGKDGTNSDTNNNAGGGGGGGASFGGTGAPGGHGGDANDHGAQGGPGGAAGLLYGDKASATLDIGSGGGGGGCSGGSGFQVGTAGGRGGGAIWLDADRIDIAGTVTADGAPGGKGGTSPSNWNHGAGGGGGASGGTLILSGTWVNVTGFATACGGAGGDGGAGDTSGGAAHAHCGAGGGGGGGGRLMIFYAYNGFQDKISVDGGAAGVGANHDMPQGNVPGSAGTTYLNGRPAAPVLQDPPDGGSASSVRPTLSWKASVDPEGEPVTYGVQIFSDDTLKTLEVEKDGIASTEYTSEIDLVKGTYWWRARAADPAGPGMWSAAWKMFTDRTPPASSVSALPKYETNASFRVSWTGSDDIAGIATYDIFVGEGTGGLTYLPWLEATKDASAIFEGKDGQTYNFYSIAVDRAKNREADKDQAEASTTVDTTAPVTTMAALAPYQGSLRIGISWTGKDATSGIQYYNVYVAPGEEDFAILEEHTARSSVQFDAEDGQDYRFYVVGCDNAGNWEKMPAANKILKTRVDLSPPVVTMRLGNPNFGLDPVFITAATSIFLDSTDNFAGVNGTFYNIDGRGTVRYANSIKESGPGFHNMTYWAADKAGNRGEDGTLWFFVDSETPATSLRCEGSYFISGSKVFVIPSTSVVLTSLDLGSGISYVEYNLDRRTYSRYTAPLRFTTGTHDLAFRAVDKVGNTEAEQTMTIMVDAVTPTTRTDGDFSSVSREDIVFDLVASDGESGVNRTLFRILKEKDKTGDFEVGNAVTVEASEGDGNYTVQYYSIDNVGNIEKTRELRVRIDTQVGLKLAFEGSPTVKTAKYLIEGKTEPGSKITIGATDVAVSADGSFSQEVDLKPGKNMIPLVITDQAGNTKAEVVTVTYDQLAASGGWLLPLILVVVVAAAIGGAALVYMGGKKKRRPPANAPPAGRPQERMPQRPPVPPARAPQGRGRPPGATPGRAAPPRAPPPVHPPTP